MRRFWRDHEEDGLYLVATVCIVAAGAITGIVIADIALRFG
jgi:hypothetical protein